MRLLAIDDEYLIALDVQHILTPWQWCCVEIDAAHNMLTRLGGQKDYDVVLLDPDSCGEELAEAVSAIERSGAAPLFSTLDPPDLEPHDRYRAVPRVVKPFSARPFIDALIKALEPVQPVKALEAAASFSSSGPKSPSPERSSSS